MSTPVPFEASISDKAFDKRSIRDNLQSLREHGFTHIHLSLHWLRAEPMSPQEVESLQEDLAATQMAVLDVHGCHPKGANLWEDDRDGREYALKLFRHRLEVTHAVGGDAMVYHVPTRVEPTPSVLERFTDGLARMEDYARSLGIKIALENHFVAENDKRALDAAFERFDDEYIAFTLDPGHANRSGNLDWLLQNCMERLYILHLNDNDAAQDRHWLPHHEQGTVDWNKVAKGIAHSPYPKPLQLEVRRYEEEHPTQEVFLQAAAQIVTDLTSTVENERAALRQKSS